MFKYNMNQIVKDKVSGFTGVILARVEYSTGCRHYGIASLSTNKDGKISEWEYLDESRLILTGASIELETRSNEDPSGDFQNPPEN